MKVLISLATMLMLLAIPACSKPQLQLLNDRVQNYNHGMRWGDLQPVLRSANADYREELAQGLSQRFENENIVDYSISGMEFDPDSNRAEVLVTYSYYTEIEQTLSSKREVQDWRYDREKKNWFIHATRVPNPIVK